MGASWRSRWRSLNSLRRSSPSRVFCQTIQSFERKPDRSRSSSRLIYIRSTTTGFDVTSPTYWAPTSRKSEHGTITGLGKRSPASKLSLRDGRCSIDFVSATGLVWPMRASFHRWTMRAVSVAICRNILVFLLSMPNAESWRNSYELPQRCSRITSLIKRSVYGISSWYLLARPRFLSSIVAIFSRAALLSRRAIASATEICPWRVTGSFSGLLTPKS